MSVFTKEQLIDMHKNFQRKQKGVVVVDTDIVPHDEVADVVDLYSSRLVLPVVDGVAGAMFEDRQ
jgi:hypothetical protein